MPNWLDSVLRLVILLTVVALAIAAPLAAFAHLGPVWGGVCCAAVAGIGWALMKRLDGNIDRFYAALAVWLLFLLGCVVAVIQALIGLL